MGEILKDTTNRIVTLCKCRDEFPNTQNAIECMKACEYYTSRAGGWCLFFVAGSHMCQHLVEKKDTTTLVLMQKVMEIYT